MKTRQSDEEIKEFHRENREGWDYYEIIPVWKHGTVVAMDGDFSVEQLEKLVKFLKGGDKAQETLHEPQKSPCGDE